MPNNRKKGLDAVREVRKILEGLGHAVEGPGYRSAFFGGRVQAIHKDMFNCFDLISYNRDNNIFIGHQVSVLEKKSEKVKTIQQERLPGWVWCRFDEGRNVGYRIFMVDKEGDVEEASMRYWLKDIK